MMPSWRPHPVRNVHREVPTTMTGKSRCLFLPSHPKSDEPSLQGFNPPDQNAPVMTLPPEILDKILEHMPTNRKGRPTLMVCALVATWWAGPSQRRLFTSVSIHDDNLQRWMDGVVLPGSRAHLLEYVRSLWYWRGQLFGAKYRMRDLPRDTWQYSSTLRNVRSLVFVNIRIENIGEEGFLTVSRRFVKPSRSSSSRSVSRR